MLSPTPPTILQPSQLNVAKENSYFPWIVLISVCAWLAIAVTIVGLFYAAMFAFFYWLGNGLLTAHLRSESVKVSDKQLADLHTSFLEVCARLNVKVPPALYVVQAGGMLNAFATRFSGRDFVVVYSDLLEALGPSSAEMKFILGHEIGHIQSRHLLKNFLLAPGLFFPLIGNAYRRAWETSCDRFGAYAAQDIEGSVRAMLILTGGREHGRTLSAEAFAGQHESERGFFVSLHELTSTYPTLSRRVTDLLALKTGRAARRPNRSPLAYFFGLFLPGGNFGGAGPSGALLVVVFIGLMAAMAIPAFQKVRTSSQNLACINNRRILSAALDQYQLENGKGPTNWSELIGPKQPLHAMPVCPLGGTYTADYDEKEGYTVKCSAAHPPLPRNASAPRSSL
jgi:Zn-dependent protease with chaperone function